MRGEELGNSSELCAFGREAKNLGGEQKWSLAAQEKGHPWALAREGHKELRMGGAVQTLSLLISPWPRAGCLPASNSRSLKIGRPYWLGAQLAQVLSQDTWVVGRPRSGHMQESTSEHGWWVEQRIAVSLALSSFPHVSLKSILKKMGVIMVQPSCDCHDPLHGAQRGSWI